MTENQEMKEFWSEAAKLEILRLLETFRISLKFAKFEFYSSAEITFMIIKLKQ